MSDLLALAERCEVASGPDRELDCLIACAVEWRWDGWTDGDLRVEESLAKFGIAHLVERVARGHSSIWRFLPAYTASLDAAMTLYVRVPERVPSCPRKATAEALRQRADVA